MEMELGDGDGDGNGDSDGEDDAIQNKNVRIAVISWDLYRCDGSMAKYDSIEQNDWKKTQVKEQRYSHDGQNHDDSNEGMVCLCYR